MSLRKMSFYRRTSNSTGMVCRNQFPKDFSVLNHVSLSANGIQYFCNGSGL